jgi:DNA-binding Xre family transcriptional regulator
MTEKHPEYEAILRTLRALLKQKKMPFSQVARHLEVSEQTVKRLFKGAECPASRLFAICDLLGVPLASVVEIANDKKERTFSLTEEQEEILASDERLYAFFDLLVEGKSAETIRQEFNLTLSEVRGFVVDLKEMNLATIDRFGRVLLKVQGSHNWREKGPLSRKYSLQQYLDFLKYLEQNPEPAQQKGQQCLTSSWRRVTRATLREFTQETHELFASFRRRATREESLFPQEHLVSVQWLAAIAPYPSFAERILRERKGKR